MIYKTLVIPLITLMLVTCFSTIFTQGAKADTYPPSECSLYPLRIISFRGTSDGQSPSGTYQGSYSYGNSDETSNYSQNSVIANGWEGDMLTRLNQTQANELQSETFWSHNQIPQTVIPVDGIYAGPDNTFYNATAVLSVSVADGAQAGIKTIQQILSNCPDTHFVLEGYSQGAMVARLVAEAFASDKGRIPFVYLIADLYRSPNENIGHDAMSVSANETGLLYAQNVQMLGLTSANALYQSLDTFYTDYPSSPSSYASGVSYALCHHSDPYCDVPLGLTLEEQDANIALNESIHESYLPSAERDAAKGTNNDMTYKDVITIPSVNPLNPNTINTVMWQKENQIENDEIHNQIMLAYKQLNPSGYAIWDHPTETEYSSSGYFLAADSQSPAANTVNLNSQYRVTGGEYTWVYDDGQASGGMFTSHTFATNGYHTISLFVSKANAIGNTTPSSIIAQDTITIYVKGPDLIDQTDIGTDWDWISDDQGSMDVSLFLPGVPTGSNKATSVTLQQDTQSGYINLPLLFHYDWGLNGSSWNFSSINNANSAPEKYLATFAMTNGTQQTRIIYLTNPAALQHPSSVGFDEDSYNLISAANTVFTHTIKTVSVIPTNSYAWITWGSPSYPYWLHVQPSTDSNGNTVFNLSGNPPATGTYHFSVEILSNNYFYVHKYQLVVS